MFDNISKILLRVSSWYFKVRADGKIDKQEWAELVRLILDILDEEGVDIDVEIRP